MIATPENSADRSGHNGEWGGRADAGGAPGRHKTSPQSSQPPPPDLSAVFAQLKSDASHYLTVHADLARLRIRGLVLKLAAGVVIAAMGLVAIIVATSLLIIGLCGAVAEGLDLPLWAAQIIVPSLGMILGGVICLITVAAQRRASFRKTLARYRHPPRGTPMADVLQPSPEVASHGS